ncbi:acetylglutamate kinase [Candidatus Oleimmundimicrobium sp.]|uniref:acetylglutamate kinase n=1 Tax=Candidatus Oleimmundimicrobium sp. TaxID=3060597 RepID=UPI0027213F05|nr:acetylglutamate kinase [Candidatus Oleimmundimicrobium sp.]MDO8886113.1 acetylglutamate kinase [Candidatus Oleimmundimicrobium sp.]
MNMSNIDNALRAKVLIHALPYIKEYYGKTVVIKYGGNAMVDEKLKESVATDIVLMKYVGINPVIIHGGGPEITKVMKKMKKEVKFVKGLRVTNKETMELVKMVLVGKVNKEIVTLINRHGRIAVGISGDDAELIVAQKFVLPDVDLGFVGEVKKINSEILTDLINDGFTPIVASVGIGSDGQSYNINADLVAAEIASALNADKLIFLTNVDGLYEDFTDKSSLISKLSLEECNKFLEKSKLEEGMLPKIKSCVNALKGGVKKAHILNGTIPHSLLLEIFTDEGIGTMLTTSR